jgi:uncharacterized membrane protein YeaQ/YmgE (transglycosylase-associated protein family)
VWLSQLRQRFWSRPRPIADALVALAGAAVLLWIILRITADFVPVRRWLAGLGRDAWLAVAPTGWPPVWLAALVGAVVLGLTIQLVRTRR